MARKQVLMSEPSQRIYNHFLFPFITYKNPSWNAFADLSCGSTVGRTIGLLPLGSNTMRLVCLPPSPSHLLHHHELSRWDYLTVSPTITPEFPLSPSYKHFCFSLRLISLMCRKLPTSLIISSSPNYIPHQTAGPHWLHQRFSCLSHLTWQLQVLFNAIMIYSLLCTI